MRLYSLLAITLIVSAFGACKRWLPDNKQKTVAFAPANNPDEVHIFGGPTLDQSTPDAPELLGGAGTYFGEFVSIRAALKFNLDKIPAHAEIRSAKLTLYSNPTPLNGQDGVDNSGPDNGLLIQRITEDWQAAEVKWASQPETTQDNEVLIPHTSAPFGDLKDVDVTALVRDMLKQEANHGFLIRLQHEEPYNFRIFCSSKYENAGKHPKLTIVYKKH